MRIDEGQAPRSTNITVAAPALRRGSAEPAAGGVPGLPQGGRPTHAMEEAQVQQMLMAVFDVRCRTAMHTAAASPCA